MKFAHAGESHDTNGMQDMMRNMMGGDGGMSGGMLFMGLFWLILGLLLFTVLALAIVALLRYLKNGTEKAALEAVKKQYAEGRINSEEFKQIRKDLEERK